MYKVVEAFSDATDGYYIYSAGDEYPRKGTHPSEKRIKSLLTRENALNKPLIVALNDTSKPESEVSERKPVKKATKTK